MVYEKDFIDYIKRSQADLEEALGSSGALYKCVMDEILWNGKSYEPIQCYSDLGIIYKYWGYSRKAERMYKFYLTILDHKNVYFSDDLDESCKREIDRCIIMKFGRHGTNDISIRLKNIIEVCSSEDLSGYRKTGYLDKIGFIYLWMGYAQLLSGDYDQALYSLKETVSCYEKYRKRQGIWQKAESYLPKALIPIIEYKLISTESIKKEARNGLEEFITLMRDDTSDQFIRRDLEKLSGYKYYFHLKESFPEIFDS